MKGLYITFVLMILFASPDVAAQKRPVGYIDPATLENARQRQGEPSYGEWSRAEAALTLLNNTEGLVPVRDVQEGRIAAVSIVSNAEFQATREKKNDNFNSFLDHVANYTPASLFVLPNDTTAEVFGEVSGDLERFPMIIIGLHTDSRSWTDNYGISPQALRFIEDLSARHEVVLAHFGQVAGLRNFNGYGPLVWAPSDNEAARALAPQLIFGAFGASGKLPAAVPGAFEAGAGDTTEALGRLKYTLPQELNVNPRDLDEIDSIVTEGMRAKAFPGAVVMAAKDGKVFYWKSFGYHEYGMEKAWQPTRKNDVFDLASITKIAATLMATMDLQEQGKIGLDETFSTYITEAAGTNKRDILIKELLTHQAGLIPFIRFWIPAMEAEGVFSADSSASHPYRVAEGMYIRKDYFEEVMWKEMLESPTSDRGEYVYSDLSMYFMRAVVEAVSGERIDHYLSREFYRPLGLSTMGFQPRYRLPLERIVPTEDDSYFRMQLLRGDVHDEGAAMAGGISGHAGLFSDANDLMILSQMLLDEGVYGGRRYLDSATIALFNTPPYKGNRRGLGFDKPSPDPSSSLMKAGVSPETFGHTGFTGTCFWVDPVTGIIYIFLSNRVNPVRSSKYIELEIRPRIRKVIYNSITGSREPNKFQ